MSFAGVLSVGTGLSHAIGRLSVQPGTFPHGITFCLSQAEVIKMEVSRSPERLVLIAKAESRKLEGMEQRQAALEASIGVRELVEALGLSERLSDYGITRDDFLGLPRNLPVLKTTPEHYRYWKQFTETQLCETPLQLFSRAFNVPLRSQERNKELLCGQRFDVPFAVQRFLRQSLRGLLESGMSEENLSRHSEEKSKTSLNGDES